MRQDYCVVGCAPRLLRSKFVHYIVNSSEKLLVLRFVLLSRSSLGLDMALGFICRLMVWGCGLSYLAETVAVELFFGH